MSDRNERIRAAFTEEPLAPEWNRDGILSGVLQRTQQVRRQRLYRLAGISIVTAVVLGVAWLQLRMIPAIAPVPATLDSIPTSPAEVAVTNQDHPGSATTITLPETPLSLIPLLGHRSSLSSDLRNLIERREEFRLALDRNPGKERADELRATIAGLDAEITSARTALGAVDRQLAILSGESPPVVTTGPVTYSESPPIVWNSPVSREPFAWAAGISLAALLIVFMALAFVRRTMRSAIDALSSLQHQASTQMSALTAGIEAIAIEVERLGENQRFMSKVIAGEAKEGATPNAR